MRKVLFITVAGLLLVAQAEAQSSFSFAEGSAEAQPGDPEYQKGMSELDAQQWEQAVATFSSAAMKKKLGVADAALYWKAYAENKLGRIHSALASLDVLERAYPTSHWLDDAKVLALEVRVHMTVPQVSESTRRSFSDARQARTQNYTAFTYAADSIAKSSSNPNQDLKLIALNSMMQSDPKTALPILQKVLLSNTDSEQVKERALFVLTQNTSPDARKILVETARGVSNAGLQLKAITFLGMMGGEDTRRDLTSLYIATSDPKVKSEVLKGFALAGSKAALLTAAKSEKNPELRNQAIQDLALAGAKDELWDLYRSSAGKDEREQILNSMALTGDSSRLLEIAKTDKEPAVRAAAVKSLGLTEGPAGGNSSLLAIYKSDTNADVRNATLDSLAWQQDGKSLVELAKGEKDPMRRLEIVRRMSMVNTPESKAYMLEILK